MKLSPAITELLSKQCGRVIATPADCTLLALDIESATQERVSVNTLKRLLGFIDDERESRITTLNIIARYLGYEDWDALKLIDNQKGNSVFDEEKDELHSTQLVIGTMIEITYLPDRRLIIKYLGGNSYLIVESQNSKLLSGDLLHIEHIVRGYPLLVSEVVCDGASLGSFTAGKAQGINYRINE